MGWYNQLPSQIKSKPKTPKIKIKNSVRSWIFVFYGIKIGKQKMNLVEIWSEKSNICGETNDKPEEEVPTHL